MSVEIIPIKAFSDNYIWVLHNGEHAVVVDPGDAEPVNDYLQSHNLTLTDILITHHHWDHVNGLVELQQQHNCKVYAPVDERIPGDLTAVHEGEKITLQSLEVSFEIMATPGHTMTHICYFNHQWLFCGDTLFSIGCGRMFEGTAEVFNQSLQKIAQLPPDTMVYCTHEYTASNIAFARSIEPDHQGLEKLAQTVAQQRAEQQPSLPVKLAQELALNPFLKTHDQGFQTTLRQQHPALDQDATATFALLRNLKDHF